MTKFLFEDEAFSFEALRAAGFANYGGADLGEVLAIANAIGSTGTEDAWQREWARAGARAQSLAEASLARGHRVSAREAFLRASNYFRTAEFFLRNNPTQDPAVKELFGLSQKTFAAATKLMDGPVEPIKITYTSTTLPGYLFLVDNTGVARPTVIYNSGFDSTLEEGYFAIAAAALGRGYNVLAFDGPGQGAAIRDRGLTFRPDWEAVITPVVDFAKARREIGQLALFGYSLGGYLCARAAAFEPRLNALILDDGMFNFYESHTPAMPPFLLKWIESERDDVALPLLEMMMAKNRSMRWGLLNGVWTFGASSYADYLRRTKLYTVEGVLDRIKCPTLVLEAENDHFMKNQAKRVLDGLSCDKVHVLLTDAEGAGDHCHMGAMARAHQVMLDWLDEKLLGGSRTSPHTTG